MKLSDNAEEILERLWILTKEERRDSAGVKELGIAPDDPGLEELRKLDYVDLSDSIVALRQNGLKEAEKTVRRHRLAERLMVDVLHLKEDTAVEEHACRFEHLLYPDVEESICTLLGHPRLCPHGKQIPEGPCCKKLTTEVKSLLFSLATASKAAKGRIAYLRTDDHRKLQKLMAMGFLPGMNVELIQTIPAYVIKIGNSEIAVDREMAETIFIRTAR
jgi:DtxR family transcriptional regulator, Mn-dependent transcriptional regulator